MATAWVECWKCDKCGHRWIKGELYPSQCASSKCRSRKWQESEKGIADAKAAAVGFLAPHPQMRPTTKIDTQELREAYRNGSPIKPDVQTLRDICAGKGTEIPKICANDQYEIPVCGKQWWEDGVHYECLMKERHREIKHGLRGMVRKLDD